MAFFKDQTIAWNASSTSQITFINNRNRTFIIINKHQQTKYIVFKQYIAMELITTGSVIDCILRSFRCSSARSREVHAVVLRLVHFCLVTWLSISTSPDDAFRTYRKTATSIQPRSIWVTEFSKTWRLKQRILVKMLCIFYMYFHCNIP